MSSSESTTDDAMRMSPMAVSFLVVASVCTPRERVEKSHRETRETIAGVKSEVAVVCDQVGELRELFNALTVHVEAYGDGRETDGRIAAMRELTPTPLTPHEGMNGSGPRTLRATRPASN
jgi:hypothetical protein